MLARTFLRRVHFFSALVPNPVVSALPALDSAQLEKAKSALEERKDLLSTYKLDMTSSFERLGKDLVPRERVALIQQLSDETDKLRAALYDKACTDPQVRLQLHEAIMATGYYQRAINPNVLKDDGIRFLLNHYNIDVRRDTIITGRAHHSLLEEMETTEESEKLLRDLLLLERSLYGPYRFAPTGGRRWFVLGLALSDIKTEKELERVLALPAIASDGNFSKPEQISEEKLWKTIAVKPNPEAAKSFTEIAGIAQNVKTSDLSFSLRVEKPKPPLDFWERLRETLLRYWVIWFALWATFFMVDEEVITLVALIFLKHRQTKIMEEEAEKTGGKVYIASNK